MHYVNLLAMFRKYILEGENIYYKEGFEQFF